MINNIDDYSKLSYDDCVEVLRESENPFRLFSDVSLLIESYKEAIEGFNDLEREYMYSYDSVDEQLQEVMQNHIEEEKRNKNFEDYYGDENEDESIYDYEADYEKMKEDFGYDEVASTLDSEDEYSREVNSLNKAKYRIGRKVHEYENEAEKYEEMIEDLEKVQKIACVATLDYLETASFSRDYDIDELKEKINYEEYLIWDNDTEFIDVSEVEEFLREKSEEFESGQIGIYILYNDRDYIYNKVCEDSSFLDYCSQFISKEFAESSFYKELTEVVENGTLDSFKNKHPHYFKGALENLQDESVNFGDCLKSITKEDLKNPEVFDALYDRFSQFECAEFEYKDAKRLPEKFLSGIKAYDFNEESLKEEFTTSNDNNRHYGED